MEIPANDGNDKYANAADTAANSNISVPKHVLLTNNVSLDCFVDEIGQKWNESFMLKLLSRRQEDLLRLCTFDIRSTVGEITLRSLGNISRCRAKGKYCYQHRIHKNTNTSVLFKCDSLIARLGRKKKSHLPPVFG